MTSDTEALKEAVFALKAAAGRVEGFADVLLDVLDGKLSTKELLVMGLRSKLRVLDPSESLNLESKENVKALLVAGTRGSLHDLESCVQQFFELTE